MLKYSILIPMYNAEKHIAECIESIKRQQFANFECIIIDDGSKDSSVSIVKNLVDNDCRFHVYSQSNLGVAKTRETLLMKSAGDYIIWIDADDYVVPEFLNTINSCIEENSIDGLIYSYQILENSNLIDVSLYPNNMYFNQLEVIKELAKEVHMPGFLWNKIFKREMYPTNLFSTGFKMLEDYYIMPDLFSGCGKIMYVNLPLYVYRQEGSSITHNLTIDMLCQNYKVYESREKKLLSLFPEIEPEIKMGRAYRAVIYLTEYSHVIGFETVKELVIKDLRHSITQYLRCKDISIRSKLAAILLSIDAKVYFFVKKWF